MALRNRVEQRDRGGGDGGEGTGEKCSFNRFQMRTHVRDKRMNYISRGKLIKRDKRTSNTYAWVACVTPLKNYRRLLRRAINHVSRARYRMLVSVTHVEFPGDTKIHSDGPCSSPLHPLLLARGPVRAYSNLYRRELKDYVINGLNYGVGYDRFDVSIRPRRGKRPATKCVPLNTSDRVTLCNYPAHARN